MLDELYITTIRNKESINNFFRNITHDIDINNVNDKFNKISFDKQSQDKTFAAIDGSFNKSKYMACFIYALSSQTILSKPENNILKESIANEMGVISTINSGRIDNILSLHMNILELKSTIDTLQKHPEIDYMLIDGSIYGTLKHYPKFNLNPHIRSYLDAKSLKIDEKLNEGNFSITITTLEKEEELLNDIKNIIKTNDLEINFEDIRNEAITYFERLEQLICIHTLIKLFGKKIVCVSKTSSTKNFYHEKIPDAAVLEYATNETGYDIREPFKQEKIVIQEVSNNNTKVRLIDYPLYGSEVPDYTYTSFFTRLEKNRNVIKIEVPYAIYDKKIAEELLNELYSISIDGYPYILKKAHNEVVIRNKDINHLTKILEIEEKTGRDMLRR